MKNRIFNKRVLSFLLTLLMIVGVFPAGSFVVSAEDNVWQIGDTTTTPNNFKPLGEKVSNSVWVNTKTEGPDSLGHSSVCDKYAHTHSDTCWTKSCNHKDGHTTNCYDSVTNYAKCNHSSDSEHTASVNISDVVTRNGFSVKWNTSHPAYSVVKAYYDSLSVLNKLSILTTKFCYTISIGESPICGHVCSEVGGSCYSRNTITCWFNYEHTHKETDSFDTSCYIYTWELKADANNNGTADDDDTKYTIKYVGANDAVLQETKSIAGVTTPAYTGATPTREFYTFKDWGTVADKVTGDATYVATWTPIKDEDGDGVADEEDSFTISWDNTAGTWADGSADEVKTETKNYGESLTAPGVVAPVDHVFSGWSPAVDMVTKTVTYFAQYTKDSIYTITYTVDGATYVVDGKEQLIYVNATDGDKVPSVADPSKDGYIFTGWTNASVIGTVPTADVTLDATWAADANRNGVADGNETAQVTLSVSEGGTATLTNGGNNKIIITNNDNVYTVVYDSTTAGGDKVVVSTTVNGKPATNQAYYLSEINGATEGKVEVKDNDNKTVTVTFALDVFTLPAAPQGGYLIEINGFNSTMKTDGLKKYVLDAIFGEGNYNINDYRVEMWNAFTLDLNEMIGFGGSHDLAAAYYNVEGQTIRVLGRDITLPASWFAEDLVVDGVTESNFKITKLAASNASNTDLYIENVMIKAKEVREKTEDITLGKTDYTADTLEQLKEAIKNNVLVNGGSANITVTLAPAEQQLGQNKQTWTATITAPATAEYLESSKSFTITATINSYTIKWDVDGVVTEQNLPFGTTIAAPVTPSKEGHTFAGWEGLTEGATVNNDVTYTANWTVNAYTVTWTVNGETFTTTDVKYGEAITAPAYTTPEGHTFHGWQNIPATMPANNITLDASLTANSYKITWVVDGVETTSSYEYNSVVTKENPVKEGWGFVGWFDENGERVDITNFKMPIAENGIKLTAKFFQAAAMIGETPYQSFDEAMAAAKDDDTVLLLKDATIDKKYTINGNITISGQFTITRADSYTGTLFEVKSGATLTLDGNLTIDGGNNYAFDKDAYMVDVMSRERIVTENCRKWFTLEEGAPIATAFMITTTGGTINLNNVTIQNNYSVNSGIISAGANSTINLTGAKIHNVACEQNSGVVANVSGANILVTINEGTVINGNHVGGNHGLFKIYSGAKVVMNGGEITNTTGWNSNGVVAGIYGSATVDGEMQRSSFIMNGGKICSNSSVNGPSNGRNAVIYGHSQHYFLMTGGTICHNIGGYAGLDAPCANGVAQITGGAIVNNVSASGNSHPDVNGSTNLTISGGTFTQDVNDWCTDDFKAELLPDGTWGIREKKEFKVEFEGLGSVTVIEDACVAEPTDKPTKDQAIFGGWDFDFTTPITESITINAIWISDLNRNNVPDTDETITIDVDGNGTVGGDIIDIGDGKYVFDSTKSNVTITVTPVVEDGISKSFVASVTGATLTYGEGFVATANLTVKNGDVIEIVVTDVPQIKGDKVVVNYNFFTKVIPYGDIYNSVISAPIYKDGAVTYTYFARPAMKHTVSIDSLDLDSSIKTLLSTIGIKDFSFDMEELWLPLDAQIEDSVDLETAVSTYLTKDRISGLLDIYNAAHDKAYDDYIAANGNSVLDKIAAEAAGVAAGGKAAYADIQAIYDVVYASAMYYGAHNFGYNANGAETVDELIRIEYSDESMKWATDATVTLKDPRESAFVSGSDVTLIYRDYTDEELLAMFGLVDANGNPIEGAIYSIQLSDPYTFEGHNVSETVYELTIKFAGNETYKAAEKTFNITIVKANVAIDVPNINTTFGEALPGIDFDFANKYGDKQEVLDSLVQIIIGLDAKDLTITPDGKLEGLGTRIQIMLPKDDTLASIFKTIGLDVYGEEGETLSLGELQGYLDQLGGLLGEFDSGNETVDGITSILDSVTGLVDLSNVEITFGGQYPTDVGVYVYGVVSTSGNYETAYDVGYICINPDATKLYLNWNHTDANGVFTWELLKHINLGATAYNNEAFTDKNADATELIVTLFLGIDVSGKTYLTADPSELADGAYIEIAFIYDFGNEMYYAVPIVRPVVIVPSAVNVELVGSNGTPNNELLKEFNNQPQGFEVIVKDGNGNVIYSTHYQNIRENPNAQVEIRYIGVQSNGVVYNSTEKPVHAGAYAVYAIYLEFNTEGKKVEIDFSDFDFENFDMSRLTALQNLYDLKCVGADIGALVIKPTSSTVVVTDKIVEEEVKFSGSIKVGSTVSGLTPDTTVISAGINLGETAPENVFDAVNGVINIDFPKWVDELLAGKLSDNITVPQLKALLENISAEFSAGMDEVLAQLPENVTLTFDDDAVADKIGAYVVIAIVTDSDHYPSIDAGYLVFVPALSEVELKWNYEDENGVFTRDLLDYIDLAATAYNKETGAANNDATKNITYKFLGINANNGFDICDDPATLPNGAYIELAYIELYINNEMVLSDLIARPVVLVASNCTVEIEEIRTEFDNTAKIPSIIIKDLEGNTIDATNGQFTYIYAGLQTNGQPYMSDEAPVHAGVYEVIVTYVEYDENGAMRYYGVGVSGILIDLTESTVDVTGGEVEYDGKGHTANVTTGSNAEGLKPDYTLISGGAWITGDINSVGINALHGNVNIDFPRWFDAVIADTEAFREGVSAAYLIDFIDSYRDDVVAGVADALAKIGVTMNVDQMNAYIDELLAVLAQMPADVTLTFVDNITYTAPGDYFYYGIVTDSDHYPSTDTGLLQIKKLVMDFDLENTTLPYNGNEQFVNIFNPVNSDFFAIITNDRDNTANILADADMMYVIDLIERVLGREIPSTVNVSDVYANVDVAALVAVIDEILETVEQYKLPATAVEMVEWIKNQLATLPTTGTITLNGELPVNVGEYKIYAITYSELYKSVVDGAVLNIAPTEITSVDATDTVYNATEQTTELTVIGVNGEVLAEGVDFVIVSGNKATGAGTYTVTIKGIGNYTGTYTADWTIDKATASVDVNDATKVYGDNDPIFSVVTNGLLGDDALVITYTREEGENVGEYVITASASDDNYNIIFTTGTLNITKATVTVDVIDASKSYGADDPEFQATVNGLKFNDKLNITFTREEGENVGEYVITATAADSNYNIIFATGKLTITTAQVIVTVNNATKVYGEKDPTFTATVTGMQNGESLNLTFTRQEGENAGEYVITATAGDANYAIAFNAGKLTITPAKLTVTLDDKNIHVGNPIPEFTWSIEGLVNGDAAADITVNASTIEGANTKIGTYKITATAENGNYTITVVNATLKVDDHTMVLVKEQAGANCQELGYAWYECTGCDYEENNETVPGTVHENTHIEIVEATCSKEGSKSVVCNACGEVVEVEVLPKNDNHALYNCKCLLCEEYFHYYKAVVTDPTCTEKGYTTHTCSVCGDSYVNTYVDALGHKYEEKVTDPTCTDKGYTTHTCSVCGDSYVDTYVDANGHSAGKVVVEKDVKPTCTDGGVLTKATYCANCHKLIERTTDVIDALGHKYEAEVTAPTCTDKGYTTHTCSVCGDSYVDTYVDAIGHTEGEPTKENVVGPTTKNAGQYDLVVRCTVCNEILSSKLVVLTAIAQNETTGVYYPTLADAIAAVKNDETIVFLANIDEDVTIKQMANVKFTIDGANHKYYGTMTVNGTGYAGAQGQELTIKNVNFVVDGYGIYAYAKNNYARNIIVDGCTFTGTNGNNEDYGIALRHVYNIVVKNTTGNKMFDLVYGGGSVTGFTAENVEVINSTNGIVLSYVNSTATFKNVNTTVAEDGVLIRNGATGNVYFEECGIDTIKYWNNDDCTGSVTMCFVDTTNNLEIEGASDNLAIKLNKVDTTVTAMEGLNASTTVSGYKVVYEGGVYKLAGIDYVAQIGTTKYESIQAAVEAAQNGDTIVILASHAVTSDATALILVSGKNITIDLNGYTLNADIVDNGKDSIRYVFRTENGASLTVKNGTVVANGEGVLHYMFSNYDTSSFIVESGNYTLSAVNGGAMFYSENSNMSVKGGTFTQVTNGWMFNTRGNGAGNVITVYGGTYNRYFIGGNDHNENPFGEVKLADGLGLRNNNDGTWSVDEHVAGEAVVENEVKADCTTKGSYEEVVYCTVCGVELSRETITVGALGHTADTPVKENYVPSTVYNPGSYDMVTYCTVCKAEIKRENFVIDKVIAVAKNSDTGVIYATLAEAIAAVKNGETIVFLANIDEDVTIKQVENLAFTIDGADYKYNGTMTINGTGYAVAQGQALTIKNIHFIVDGYGISANEKKNYARNITVDGCTFTGTNGDNYDYGMILHSVYNIVVKNTIGTNLFDLVYGRGSVDGFTAENVEVLNSANGIWLTYPAGKITFTNVTTATNGGTGVGFKNLASGTVTFNNCDIDVIKYSEEGTKALKMIFNDTVNNLVVNEAFGHKYLSIVLNNVNTTVESIAGLKASTEVNGYRVAYENGKYFLVEIDYVAQVGDNKYESIQAAVNAVQTGDTDTIVILKDHELTWDGKTFIDESLASMVVVAGKTVTINLNGKKLTVNANKMNTDLYAVFAADNGGHLTMKDSVGGGSVSAIGVGFKASVTAYCLMMAYEPGTGLVVEGGSYYMEAAHDSLIYSGGDDIVVVNDGRYTLGNVGTGENGKPWIFNALGANDRNVIVNGGTFNADVDSQHWVGEVAIKAGYCAQPNVDGTWTIKEHIVEFVPGKEPTATEAGYTESEKCSDCGKVLKESETIVAKGTVATIGNVCYATLAEALAAAQAGETVTLVDDANETTVILMKGITLDLNGQTLTADYLVAFNGNHVVDNATEKGLLKIKKNNISLAKNNSMMPVYNEQDGYLFISINHQLSSKVTTDGISITYRPSLGKDYNSLLNNGAENNGLKLIVRLSWIDDQGADASQNFVFTEDLIKRVYSTGKGLKLVVSGMTGHKDITVDVIVRSDIGVESVQEALIFNPTQTSEG